MTLSLRMAAFLALCVSPCFAGTAGTLLITEQNGALSVSFQLAGSDFSGSGPGGTYNAAIGFDDGTNEWTAGPSYYDVLDGNYVYEAIYGVAWADPGDPGQFNILNISISGSGDTYFNFATDGPLSDGFQGCIFGGSPGPPEVNGTLESCPVLANDESIEIPITENPPGGDVYEGTLTATWDDLDGSGSTPEPSTGAYIASAMVLLALARGMKTRKASEHV